MKPTASNLRRKPLTKVLAVLAVLAAWISVPYFTSRTAASSEALMGDIELYAHLLPPGGGANPWGAAEWELDDDGRREIEVEVFNANAAGVNTVFVDGANIGSLFVDGSGYGRLRLRTQDGQPVPMVNVGSSISVQNNGNVLVSGLFGNTPAPSPSPSVSPSGSPSPSVSPTPNGSPSPTVSPTPNGSPSPTVSPTPNGSPSPTVSPTPTGSPSPSPSPNGGNLFAGLTGPTLNGAVPNGFGQFEIHSSRRELEVRVRQVNLAIGTPLNVVVDNAVVGTLFLESGGEGRLRLRSDEGQNVPNVISGSTIYISWPGNGAILSGIFSGNGGPTPSPSPSASPSPSPTGSPSPSPSPTGSPEPSPSPTASPSPSPSPTATPAGRSFDASLTRVATVATAANAAFTVTLNAAQTEATVRGTFNNLSSAQTNAWIEAEIGSGAVIRQLGTVGGQSGSFASVTFAVTPAQVQMLRGGVWSMVVASAANPNGEIRGRLQLRTLSSDFDGDGNHDLALFRPGSNVWYMQNGAGFSYDTFGTASDKIVAGDYDGDGRTDIATVSIVNGQSIWNVKRSSDSGVSSTQFGIAEDKPVRGDFDGDGRLDIAVYRPSNGMWYIQKSDNSGYSIVRFGLAEDRPTPADLDGDGKDDISVFRPSTGTWYWIRSSDQQSGAMRFGVSEDIPVRGDFDGDGKFDVAVYRPSTGAWYIYRSSDGGYTVVGFGMNGDIPVAGHYDEDRKTDIAVYRQSDGYWYILRSTDGAFQALRFGLNGDRPVIAQ